MNILIVTPSVSPSVAVGIDAMAMKECLIEEGHRVDLVAGDWRSFPDRACAPESNLCKAALSTHDFMIYQFAGAWPLGARLLGSFKGRRVIRFHGITPPALLAGFSEVYEAVCSAGLKKLEELALDPTFWYWPTSIETSSVLRSVGSNPLKSLILPPSNNVHCLHQAYLSPTATNWIEPDSFLILYVAAFRPHKRHREAIRIFQEAQSRIRRPMHLVLAGTTDSLIPSYLDDLQQLADEARNIHVFPDVSIEVLNTLYSRADVFICTSAHEGFCVPVIEAMSYGVPVIAWYSDALADTMGGSGLLVPRAKLETGFADTVISTLENDIIRTNISARSRTRYLSFTRERVKTTLIQAIALIHSEEGDAEL